MDDLVTICIFALVIFAVSIISAQIPHIIKEDASRLHTLIAFSAGVMVGVLFIMLLPEAFEKTIDAGYNYNTACYLILIGFMLITSVDFLVKRYTKSSCNCSHCQERHSHDITSTSAFIGLSIHSFFDGLALAAAFLAGENVGIMVLIALCLHKAVVVFSLSSTMMMSKKKEQASKYMLAFSAISPLAAVISYICLDSNSVDFAGPALCFAAGIFMFVAVCDMLPEAFHHKDKDPKPLIWLIVGILVVVFVSTVCDSLMGGIEI